MMRAGVHGPLAQSGNTPPPVLEYAPPPDDELPVIHADEDILVLSKPAGLLSVPGKGEHLQDCMEIRAQKEFPSATIIHRLDRATSGIFVMALNARAHRIIGLQFEKRRVAKNYMAIVAGMPDESAGRIELPLRTDWYNRPKQMVDPCLGREAITDWRAVEHVDGDTRVELLPRTGRTHQLRVHMQAIGHPIVGDEFYATPEMIARSSRLMLHAQTIMFRHPQDGRDVTYHDACPF